MEIFGIPWSLMLSQLLLGLRVAHAQTGAVVGTALFGIKVLVTRAFCPVQGCGQLGKRLPGVQPEVVSLFQIGCQTLCIT